MAVLPRPRRGGLSALVLALVLALVGLGGAASAVTLVAPTDLAPAGTTVTENPTLTWTRLNNATAYTVQVSASSAFDTVLWSAKTVNRAAVPAVALPAGTLYWRVRGEAGTTLGPWAQSTYVRSALPTPSGLSPANATVFNQPTQAPVVSWTAVTGATSYSVEVAPDSTFASAVRTYTTKSPSVTVTNLTPNKTYYWRVRASYSTTLFSAWAETRDFQISNLVKPTRVAPANGATIDDVVLDWAPVVGAGSYELQVGTDATLSSALTLDLKGITGTNYSPPSGLANRQYYWRVRPVDTLGNKLDWSAVDIWTFTRGWSLQPTLEYPANAATVGDPFFYQWTPVKLADRYLIQLSTSSSFSTIEDTCSTAHTTYVPAGLGDCMPDADGVYYWRVAGQDGPGPLGGSGATSSNLGAAQVFSFTYVNARPAMTSPATGASVSVPTLKWSAVSGAAKYKVTLYDLTAANDSSFFTTATSFTPRSSLVVGHNYRWQVQAVSVSGREGSQYAVGDMRTFTVVAQAAPTASTPEPTVSSPSSARFPTLTWTPVINANSYEILVRPSGSTTWDTLVDPFYYPAGEDDTVSWLLPGTYQWKVNAFQDGTQLSTTATLGTFTITPLAAASGQRVAMTGQATEASATRCSVAQPSTCTSLRQTPVLAWNADPDAAFYKVYLAKDAAMTIPVSGYPKSVESNKHMPVTALPDNTGSAAYFWAVQPCRASGKCGTIGNATNAFSKLSKPAQLLTPTADQIVNSSEITFTWRDYLATNQDATASPLSDPVQTVNSRIEAKQYRLQVSADSSFGTLIDNILVDQQTFTSYANTYPEGKLYWRVQAIDGGGNSLPWSAARAFTKRSPLVVPISPLNGVSVPGTAPFTWNPAAYAVSYDIEVYKNADTSGTSTNRVILSHSKMAYFAPATPLTVSSSAYVWRIRPVDVKGRAGRWTSLTDPAMQFFVVGGKPSLVSPAGQAFVPSNEGLFTWTGVAGATNYRFERRLQGSSSVSQSVVTVATSFAPTAKIGTGQWEWRVVALDTAGKDLGATAWRRFTVDATAPKVTDKAPTGTVSRTAKFTATFNEEVMNVTDLTFTITPSGGSNALPAQVTLNSAGTTATLNPDASLVVGKKYVVKLTTGITDLQGNHLTSSVSWTITAA